jgi:hypothetical protein
MIYGKFEDNFFFQSKNKWKIEIDRGLFDPNSPDQNCVLSVDQNFHNQLTEFF